MDFGRQIKEVDQLHHHSLTVQNEMLMNLIMTNCSKQNRGCEDVSLLFLVLNGNSLCINGIDAYSTNLIIIRIECITKYHLPSAKGGITHIDMLSIKS